VPRLFHAALQLAKFRFVRPIKLSLLAHQFRFFVGEYLPMRCRASASAIACSAAARPMSLLE
jgi:hypothetical protein